MNDILKLFVNLLAFIFIRVPVSIFEMTILIIGTGMGIVSSVLALLVTAFIIGALLFGCALVLLFI